MATVTICSDLGAQENKVCHCFFSPSICHELMGPDAMIFVFWMLSLKPSFSFSSFTFKRLFSSSLSAKRVVSSAYLRLLILFPAILIQVYASSSLAFCMEFQFSSVNQLCLTFCGPVDCSIPDFHAHHKLQELAQTHVYWVNDGIQPSSPLLFPSPPTFNFSQHQGLFKWVSSSHQVSKVLEFQLQQHSFQGTLRTDLL